MLSLIARLSSMAALILGVVGGGVLSGGAAYVYNQFVENPRIIAVEQAKAKAAVQIALSDAALRVMAAAIKARDEERARQHQIMEDAKRVFEKTVDDQQQQIDDSQDQNDKEIRNHEQELLDAGRSSPLTDADFEWLRQKPN